MQGKLDHRSKVDKITIQNRRSVSFEHQQITVLTTQIADLIPSRSAIKVPSESLFRGRDSSFRTVEFVEHVTEFVDTIADVCCEFKLQVVRGLLHPSF